MRSVKSLFRGLMLTGFVLSASIVYAQEQVGVTQQPASVVVNQNQVATPSAGPLVPVNMPRPYPPQAYPPPYPPQQQVPSDWMRNGYREEFTRMDRHDVRPLRDWETPGAQTYAPQAYAPQAYAPQQYATTPSSEYSEPHYDPRYPGGVYYTQPTYQYTPPATPQSWYSPPSYQVPTNGNYSNYVCTPTYSYQQPCQQYYQPTCQQYYQPTCQQYYQQPTYSTPCQQYYQQPCQQYYYTYPHQYYRPQCRQGGTVGLFNNWFN